MSCAQLAESVLPFRDFDAGPWFADEPLLTSSEECELSEAVGRGDSAARDRLVRANVRLVFVIAREYRGRGLDLEDLIGEGNLGLFRAAERFDSRFGTRFSTYATYWIRQSIRAAMTGTSAAIRLPQHMVTLLAKWHRAEADLALESGRAPSFDEVADAMGLGVAHRELVEAALRSKRMHSQEEGDERDRLEEYRAARRPEDEVDQLDDARHLRDRIARLLDPRERRIIELRYGLEGGEPMSLKEVALSLGITREWVRKIEMRAVRKLGDGEWSSAED